MSTFWNVLIVILLVLVIALALLYYFGQKAQKKAYTPGRKNQRFNFDHGDRWVASTTPRKFAHDKKIKNNYCK